MQRRILLSALATALVATGCGTQGLQATGARQDARFAAQAVPGEILVKFKPAATRHARFALTSQLGLTAVSDIPQIDAAVFRARGDVRKAIAEIERTPGVLFAEPNYVEKLPPVKEGRVIPRGGRGFDDPMMGDQWALGKINAEGAWKVTTGDSKTVLAIVDTGVDYNHPDLKGRVVTGYDFANDDTDAMDDQGHGTHCAGIAAASAGNGVGIAGMAPGVTIMPVKVLSASGSGSTSDVVNGIIWAVDHGATVVSLSLGGAGNAEMKQQAIDYAVSKDVLCVVAMGNNGREYKVYPGANKGAMAVGATDVADKRASFSNYGDWISVGAPGHNILSTIPGGGYKAYSGTSMATPYVAGLASLVRSKHPDWTYQQVRAHIEKTADDIGEAGFDKQFGHGRINAAAALQ